ncbi:MAG: Ku protein [Pararhizobium sp.]
MAPRANWKGWIKVDELTCAVALYTGASTSDRITFHTVNRETGNRVHREFVDSETGKPVDKADQVKGYEVGDNDYVVLEPEEISAAVPESDKTLAVEAFVACDDIDTVYIDRPYYLAPSDAMSGEAFVLLREAMRREKVAALARTVLFRRVRTVLIRPHGEGLIGSTMNFDYEVRAAADVFDDIPEIRIEGEMLDLAKHIINPTRGTFDPAEYKDRYEAAVAELVKAKIEGRKIEPKKERPPEKVVDLMEALRQSAGATAAAGKGTKKAASRSRSSRKTAAEPRRKAG